MAKDLNQLTDDELRGKQVEVSTAMAETQAAIEAILNPPPVDELPAGVDELVAAGGVDAVLAEADPPGIDQARLKRARQLLAKLQSQNGEIGRLLHRRDIDRRKKEMAEHLDKNRKVLQQAADVIREHQALAGGYTRPILPASAGLDIEAALKRSGR